MHIPDNMLNGMVCPVTAGVSAVGIGLAAWAAARRQESPGSGRFAAVSALIFAGQMMNFPVQSGTSGHLLGGVLAASLLGLPHGILAMAMVVAVQCLVFADGGATVLGANLFNMALIGAGLGGWLAARLRRLASGKRPLEMLGVAAAAWASVAVASISCSLQLAWAGAAPLGEVLPAMLGVHLLIGVGEALVTVACCLALAPLPLATGRPAVVAPLGAAAVIALALSPFASGSPDGLEWVAEKLAFLHEGAPVFASPLPDYTVAAVANEAVSTGLAGLIGVALTFILCASLYCLLPKPSRSPAPRG